MAQQDFNAGIWAGLICGGIVSAIFTYNLPFTLYNQAKEQIKICEKELPRNEYCVVTAKIYNKQALEDLK